jgi:uncharacterized membrane protein YkgB
MKSNTAFGTGLLLGILIVVGAIVVCIGAIEGWMLVLVGGILFTIVMMGTASVIMTRLDKQV